jgi:exonuclease III
MDSENILVWNDRGLNGQAHRAAVAALVAQERVSLICVQETKISVIDGSIMNGMLGMSFQYAFLPTEGTRGGILVAWRVDVWSASHTHLSDHVLTLKLSH